MFRTPEQEAARKERQRQTSQHVRCACGNVAKRGTTQCSRCEANSTRIENDNNFQFMLDGRLYIMAGGALCVDDCYYEEEGGEVTYSLARAHARTLT